MMDFNEAEMAADFQPVLDALNEFDETHDNLQTGQLLIALCALFIKEHCGGNPMAGLDFVRDLTEAVASVCYDEDEEAAVQ